MSSKFADLTKRKTAEPPLEPAGETASIQGRPMDPGSLTQQLKRGEAKQLKAIVLAELHKRVKLASVELERDISEITAEALEAWLSTHA
jgi:hypothetical protein